MKPTDLALAIVTAVLWGLNFVVIKRFSPTRLAGALLIVVGLAIVVFRR